MRRGAGVAAAAACGLVVAGALGGCTTALGQQYKAGDQKNFIGSDGRYSWIAPSKRGAPVALSGTTADGTKADVAAWRGSVVVVNVWYAGCGPCRAEAPDLAAAATATPAVHFLGVNTRDDAATITAFDTSHAMPYPSVVDSGSGAALLSLRGTVPPAAVPSTIILDRRGRPAARILGRLDPAVLKGLVQDVEAGTLTPHVDRSASASASS